MAQLDRKIEMEKKIIDILVEFGYIKPESVENMDRVNISIGREILPQIEIRYLSVPEKQ